MSITDDRCHFDRDAGDDPGVGRRQPVWDGLRSLRECVMKLVHNNAFSELPIDPAYDLPRLLADNLKAAFSRVLNERMPDELAHCLTRLMEREAATKGDSESCAFRRA